MYSYPIQKGDEKTRTLGHTGTRWGGRGDPSSRLHAPQAAAAPHRSKAEPRESHMARPPAHHTPHTARPKPVISAKPATYHALPSAQQFRALLKKDGTRAKKKIGTPTLIFAQKLRTLTFLNAHWPPCLRPVHCTNHRSQSAAHSADGALRPCLGRSPTHAPLSPLLLPPLSLCSYNKLCRPLINQSRIFWSPSKRLLLCAVLWPAVQNTSCNSCLSRPLSCCTGSVRTPSCAHPPR